MKKHAAIAAITACLAAPALADIEKIATLGGNGMSFHWWPKVAPPSGWQHEREQSLYFGMNAMSRIGTTFKHAESVMYAKAVFKPREQGVKSLAEFIEKDKASFLSHDPTLSIREGDPLESRDGKRFPTFSFTPIGSGNWERVAYGEEGEFYLLFVLSARSEGAYKSSVDEYEQLVRGYKE